MSDLVRIRDNDTGGTATVGREYADLLTERGAATILTDTDAVDPVFGTPLPPEPGVAAAAAPYADRKVDELRTELAARELPTSGTKPELVERLGANDTEKGDNR